MATVIDPRAIVDPTAELADDVTIGPFAIINSGVKIGPGTTIGAHVFIDTGTTIGARVSIFPGAVLGTAPQDLKYNNEPTQLILGDDTTIREYCTLHRATPATGLTKIGSNCLIMAYAHVAHDCRIGDRVVIANGVQMGGHTHIDDWAIIGGATLLHQFVHVGAHVMVGGGLRVSKDVPPFILAGGNPLTFEGLNIIGLKRRGFSSETIAPIEHAYKILYESGFNVSDGIRKISSDIESIPEVLSIIEFVKESRRGIITRRRHSS